MKSLYFSVQTDSDSLAATIKVAALPLMANPEWLAVEANDIALYGGMVVRLFHEPEEGVFHELLAHVVCRIVDDAYIGIVTTPDELAEQDLDVDAILDELGCTADAVSQPPVSPFTAVSFDFSEVQEFAYKFMPAFFQVGDGFCMHPQMRWLASPDNKPEVIILVDAAGNPVQPEPAVDAKVRELHGELVAWLMKDAEDA